MDAIEWHCYNCGTPAHRAELMQAANADDLPVVYQAFNASKQAYTCGQCGDVHPCKEPPEGRMTL